MSELRISDKLYDILQIICRMILPVADFITALGSIWGIPFAAEICATLTAFHVLLGTFLKIVSDNYKRQQATDNYIVVETPFDESEADG